MRALDQVLRAPVASTSSPVQSSYVSLTEQELLPASAADVARAAAAPRHVRQRRGAGRPARNVRALPLADELGDPEDFTDDGNLFSCEGYDAAGRSARDLDQETLNLHDRWKARAAVATTRLLAHAKQQQQDRAQDSVGRLDVLQHRLDEAGRLHECHTELLDRVPQAASTRCAC
jgi:hypothetical protein